jgi:hypothetical protein
MKDVCEELAMPGDALHRHGRPKSVKLKNANLVSALGWVLSVREYSDFLPTNERLSFKTRYCDSRQQSESQEDGASPT